MSLLSRGNNARKELEQLHKFAKEVPKEVGKTTFFLKGAILGTVGGVVKVFRGMGALLGGTILAPIMTGLGYQKKDILKIINSPLESWWKKIKEKWAAVPKTEGDVGVEIIKAILVGIPLGLGSGLLALVENVLSGVWTFLVGGWLLGLQAANLSKKIGETIDNSSIFSAIARTNVFGTMILAGAKIAKSWNPAYGNKLEEIRQKYPNAIDYVRGKVQGLIDGPDKKDNLDQYNQYKRIMPNKKITPHISDQLQNRAADLRNEANRVNRTNRIRNSVRSELPDVRVRDRTRDEMSNMSNRSNRIGRDAGSVGVRVRDREILQERAGRFRQYVASENNIMSRKAQYANRYASRYADNRPAEVRETRKTEARGTKETKEAKETRDVREYRKDTVARRTFLPQQDHIHNHPENKPANTMDKPRTPRPSGPPHNSSRK